MASVQYGSIVTALKGNVGGQTFQNGNIAKVLRNKGYRAGTSSLARQSVTSSLVSQSVRWRSLSRANQLSWASMAPYWAFSDKYGNTYYGSGYQLFVAYNTALLAISEPVVSVPSLISTPETITVATCTYSLAVGPVINWTSVTSEIQVMQVFASAPMSAGKNNNSVRYKQIGIIRTDVYPAYTGAAEYNNVYGPPQIGSKVVFKLQLRTISWPRVFQTIIVSAIVTA